MMGKLTPEEQAKDLVRRNKSFVYGYIGSSMLTNTEYPEAILANAKNCSNLACDTFIAYLKANGISGTLLTHWIEVKQEIEKI